MTSLFLSACLPQATRTAAPLGGSEVSPSAETPAGTDFVIGKGADKGKDETANRAGPGGEMPGGTLAPPPLVPINFSYKAEGTYCRFESDPSQVMVWGRLYRKEGEGQFESEPTECIEHCKDKDLKVFHQKDGLSVTQVVPLNVPPDFRFVIETDDPKHFGLSLVYNKTVTIIGQDPIPAGQGFLVDVSDFQPYSANGAPAYCPDRILMQRTTIRP